MIRFRRFPAILLIIFSALLFSQCAKIEPPPGGPEDKTGPSVLSTVPVTGAVKIPRSNTVAIAFSETVDHRTAEANCFITPLTEKKLKFKWRGKILNITMPDSFAEKTTYIVNIGSSVADFRGNKMAQSFQFAFSTGDSINQGKITGKIFQGPNPASGMSIGLYDTVSAYSYKTFDSVIPKFLTQSGGDGKYILDYLPYGKFVALAFKDINNNKRFDYPDEDYGIPSRLTNIKAGGESPGIDFYMRRTDTTSAAILSTSVTLDRLVKVRFSRKFPGKLLAGNLDKIFMIAEDSGRGKLYPSSLFENPEDTLTTYSLFFPKIEEGSWRLALEKGLFSTPDTIGLIEGSLMQVKFGVDQNRPTVVAVSQSGQTNFPSDSTIEILFSEPIDKIYASDTMAIIRNSDSSIVPASQNWKDDFRLDLSIPPRWGGNYRLDIHQPLIRDMAGNISGDSVKSYSFKTYSKDSLGAISGTMTVFSGEDSLAQVYLKFNSLSNKQFFQEKMGGKEFRLSLPGGKYLLSGFIDRNGNQKQDIGFLTPFELAEPSAVYPDTIRVRPRFETAGIDFLFK